MRVGIFWVAPVFLLAACAGSPPTDQTGADAGRYGQAGGAATSNSAGGLGGNRNGAARTGPGSQQDLAQTAGDRVFFDTDKSDPKPEGRQIIQRQAEWLKRFPNVVVTVEGHGDERGTREYNLALGERRAQNVKNQLLALGISANRVSTVTYGKERPAVVGSVESSWAQNRRAVTVVE
jgi:peptidoglycan-associated lipoprotein